MNESPQHKQNDQSLNERFLVNLHSNEQTPEDDSYQVDTMSQETYDLLATLDAAPDATTRPSVAFAALQTKLKAEQHPKITSLSPLPVQEGQPFIKSRKRRPRTRWILAAVAAVLAALLILPNASVLADQFLSLFRVQQFQPVTVDPQQLSRNLLTDLQSFGSIQIQNDNSAAPLSNPTQAQVEQYTHFPFLLPKNLPTGVGNNIHFFIVSGGHATFVFNATTAQAYMKQIGDGNIPIPAQLVGASYTITISPGAVADYTNGCPNGNGIVRQIVNGASSAKTNSSSDVKQCTPSKQFVVAEIPTPTINGVGKASLSDLRDFMLSLPHLSAPIHTLLQHVDLQAGTVPVPMPPQANAQNVTVQGASGVLMFDQSLHEGVLLWQAHNRIYLLTANVSDGSQLLTVANSLN